MPIDTTTESLPDTARLIRDAIADRGHRPCSIAKQSASTARDFIDIDPSLKTCSVHESQISRWQSGATKRPGRAGVIVLMLTLLRLDDPRYSSWSDEKRMEAYNEATAFARMVLSAAPRSQPWKNENDSVDFTGARREHTVELLGEEYGMRLLREASETQTSDAPAKLALLHHLHGNVDDVRFWASVAAVADRDYAPPASIQESLEEARRYALGYQRAQDFAAARIYLSLAADKEDALSAFRLGIMAESEADVTEAITWYKKAAAFGHPDGDQRAYRIWRTLH